MPDVLVYVETAGDAPTPLSLELLSGARALANGCAVAALVVENGPATRRDALAAADRISIVKGDPAGYTSEGHLAVLSRMVAERNPDLVLVPNSYVGLDLAAGLAAASNRPLLSHCIAVDLDGTRLKARCQVYNGKAEASVECALPAVAAVNPGVFKASGQAGAAVFADEAPAEPSRTMTVEALESGQGGDLDITLAERLVCVGRGIGDQDNIELARNLAEILGAELVGSRPVVDQGWLEKSRQVGKSGRTVKPKLYLAVGVSGAPEHLEGMRDSDLIIAVNSDPAAPIFDVAHYGIVCDALEFLPNLTQKLQDSAS